MKVYVVTEKIKPSGRFKIIKIFDNPESATECLDYWQSFFEEDDPFIIEVLEYDLEENYKIS